MLNFTSSLWQRWGAKAPMLLAHLGGFAGFYFILLKCRMISLWRLKEGMGGGGQPQNEGESEQNSGKPLEAFKAL
jgi:hypothetical protein